MRYMMLVKSREGVPPTPELMAAIGGLAQEMFAKGALVDMGGLAPSAAGARIRLARGTLSVTDGPFTEAKELVGGYAVMEAASKAEALEFGRRFMQVHADILGDTLDVELEIRQLGVAAGRRAVSPQQTRPESRAHRRGAQRRSPCCSSCSTASASCWRCGAVRRRGAAPRVSRGADSAARRDSADVRGSPSGSTHVGARCAVVDRVPGRGRGNTPAGRQPTADARPVPGLRRQ